MDTTMVAAVTDSARASVVLNQWLPGLNPELAAALSAMLAGAGVYVLEMVLLGVQRVFPKAFTLVSAFWTGFKWILNPLLGAILGKLTTGSWFGGAAGYGLIRGVGALFMGGAKIGPVLSAFAGQNPELLKKLATTMALVGTLGLVGWVTPAIADTASPKAKSGFLAAVKARTSLGLGVGQRWETEQDRQAWAGGRVNLALTNALGVQVHVKRDWKDAPDFRTEVGLWLAL